MGTLKVLAYVGAAIFILMGVLFLIAGFGAYGSFGTIAAGIAITAVGFGLLWFGSRKPKAELPDNVTYQVDLSGDVNLETMKCKSCGGTLSSKDVKMVAGAPVVTCPYCGTVYQLTEEPKW